MGQKLKGRSPDEWDGKLLEVLAPGRLREEDVELEASSIECTVSQTGMRQCCFWLCVLRAKFMVWVEIMCQMDEKLTFSGELSPRKAVWPLTIYDPGKVPWLLVKPLLGCLCFRVKVLCVALAILEPTM